MVRVSMTKLADYAEKAHINFFETLAIQCADLNSTEQLTVVLMILQAVRELLKDEVGEELVSEVESALKEYFKDVENRRRREYED